MLSQALTVAVAALDLANDAGWHARLALRFAPRGPATRLVAREHHGPLAVQRTFQAADGSCHAYLLHPPGGVVGGDRLEIDVAVESGAHTLATSPGAAKFYRSAGPRAHQAIRLTVDADARFDWLPQETIVFAGADVASTTRVRLAADARHCGWEILCLGRPVSGAPFDAGRWDARLAIDRDDRPLLRERLDVAAATRDGPAGLRGFPVIATFWATPATPALRDALHALLAAQDAPAGATLVDGLLVVRLLGDSSERIRHLLQTCWQTCRAALDDTAPAVPRIWAT
jgi:urease accessory protein